MVSKEEEIEARKICAWTNFSKDCNQCAHTLFPMLEWITEPHFNIEECNEWKEYLAHPVDKLYRRIRCLFGLHNYIVESTLANNFAIYKICTRCEVKYEWISNKDYTKGKWVKVDD